MSDYIPDSDADFLAWLNNFVNYGNLNLAQLHLVAADFSPFLGLREQFTDALTNNEAAQANARGARVTKDNLRDHIEELIRPFVGRLQGTAGITDEQRENLGITVRSTTRSRVAAPTTRPVVTIDTRQRLEHTIIFVDELTPSSKAKPPGVQGCEIYMKVGGALPAGPSELKYLATDTRTPYVVEFEGTQGGQIAYYMLRWISTRGETGPWSQTVSATITA